MSIRDLILIVDDDDHIRETVRFALAKAGLDTIEAADGREALDVFKTSRPALVILDIMMPELDGTDVCRIIRSEADTPIIFLTSRDDEVDRVVGLELGGDDYVSKPFSPRELTARVRAVLRRSRSSSPIETKLEPPCPTVLEFGHLKLDIDCRRAYWQNEEIGLTATEFGILRTLLGHPGKVYSRDDLMDGAYIGQNFVSDRTIDSHIRHIRRKFGERGDVIETVHSLGYRIGACAPRSTL